ncbi:F-box domain containing protein [Tanacetum coccineum]
MSDYLPFDIQVKIMNKLPVQSLLKFRMVSKSWKFTIDSYIFIRDYGSRESDMCCFNLKYSVGNEHFMFSVDGQMSFTPLNTHFPLTNIKPVTTSKGVWCFSFGSHLGAILWNPSIRKFLGIELPYMPRRPAIEKIVWGFGVRPDTLDPTILNISMPFYGDGPWHVVMYTLNSDTWTFLGNYRMPRVGIRIKRSWGLAVVGSCIFWGCSKTFFNDDGSSYKLYMLVSFDLINHQFNVLDIPTELKNQLPIPFYISKLGNSLVISGNHIYYENRYICAWLLEVEPAVVTSWRVLFIIPSQNIAKLCRYTRDEDPIVEVDRGQQMVHTLQVYDRSSQQFQNVSIEANGGSFFIGPYKESLILLNV